eukprot:Skav207635  [mRNA]  locus=scaffold1172:32876:36861:+ [translate_table: standard]
MQSEDIDVDKSGAIDYEEFIQDGSGSIELKEFIVVLSRYTAAAKTEKLKFAFMMFDEDGSGLIDRRELVEMLRASFVVEGFSPEELEERADKACGDRCKPRGIAVAARRIGDEMGKEDGPDMLRW